MSCPYCQQSFRTTYSEKLRDPRWQKLRLQVFERDGWACLACGDKTATLCVHHLRYTGEPWDAPLGDLETLCEYCHSLREMFNEGVVGQFRTIPSRPIISFYETMRKFSTAFPGDAVLPIWQKAMQDKIDAEGRG